MTPIRRALGRWMPAFAASGIAWIAFLSLGSTPVLRASGMAAAILGMSMALRPMGPALAFVGGLALAFSPSFWVQTGGAQSLEALEIAAALLAAGAAAGGMLILRRRPALAFATAFAIFAVIFLVAIGTPRSLRVTTLLAAWMIYLLTEGALASNPRPDEIFPARLGAQHTYGLLLLLAVGIANDPLFALFSPAVALHLFLARVRLPLGFWIALGVAAAIGISGIAANYVSPEWWSFPAEQTPGIVTHLPFIISYAWHEPFRWIKLIELIVGQFTVFGLILGVLGLARLSRWHPPVGVVTMVAYGFYALFGLTYFGFDAPVLLLPLLMMQVFWMTYAAYTFSAWLRASARAPLGVARVSAAAVFALLPLSMLLQIAGVV